MRHRKSGRKLNRTASHRKALLANLATSLFEHERIQTTTARAKELRPFAEKLITLARRGDLHARRKAAAVVKTDDALQKLFAEIAPRFADRPGGYTRIIHIGRRTGDNAPMSLIELVDAAEAHADEVDVQSDAVSATDDGADLAVADDE
jgi:large subunit ribosomal protein L17